MSLICMIGCEAADKLICVNGLLISDKCECFLGYAGANCAESINN